MPVQYEWMDILIQLYILVSAVSHMLKIGQSTLKKDAPNAPNYRFTFDEHSPSARPLSIPICGFKIVPISVRL